MSILGKLHTYIQWEYYSSKLYSDPFNDIELDIIITSPSRQIFKIPTFWIGGQKWAVRFIPEEIGSYHINTTCTDKTNQSLHNVKDKLTVEMSHTNPYPSLKVSENKQYLTKNNTPFFLFSDTWWMALSNRLSYPEDFKHLCTRRKEQGFNTIMLVAGLFPDMDSFDPRCKNEAGFPWEDNYTRINPAYFDKADERIRYLVEDKFTPMILGAWGYYLQHLGIKKMKQHWRYIIARWGVYPVIWCIAGEATMPYYLSTSRVKDAKIQLEGWSTIGKYIKKIDPFKRLLTIHPTEIGREQVTDKTILDINLLQASHHGYQSVSKSIALLQKEHKQTTLVPLIAEVNYEGILKDTHDAVQRLTFWSAILSGSKGFGYGANGIWQINTRNRPFGASPHGASWGDVPWEEALLLKGATQLGFAKTLLETYKWWLLKPQQHTLSPYDNSSNPKIPRIAGIGTQFRIVYFYASKPLERKSKFKLTHLNPNYNYTAFFWNPKTTKQYPINTIQIDPAGTWKIPTLPTSEDWILILQCSSCLTNQKKPLISTKIYTIKKMIKSLFLGKII